METISSGEREWIDTQFRAAALITERYTGFESTEAVPSLEQLSASVGAWMDDDETRIDVNTLVNAVGVTTGEHVRSQCGLSWVVATDAAGSELALHGDIGHVLIYPANAVAKRVTRGESDLATYANVLIQEVLKIQAS